MEGRLILTALTRASKLALVTMNTCKFDDRAALEMLAAWCTKSEIDMIETGVLSHLRMVD